MSEIKAVLFDMDGVILDTEKVCRATWKQAAEEFGVKDIESVFLKCVGRSRADSDKILRENISQTVDPVVFRNRTSELFDFIDKNGGLELKPYASQCLERLKNCGFRIGLASSTRAVKVRPQLTNAGVISFFETLTTGDMVAHSKPDPEIYLKAAASLGMETDKCVAIEDSPNGVRAAAAAGIKCIMVPDLIEPDEEIKALCWKILPSLKEVAELLEGSRT